MFRCTFLLLFSYKHFGSIHIFWTYASKSLPLADFKSKVKVILKFQFLYNVDDFFSWDSLPKFYLLVYLNGGLSFKIKNFCVYRIVFRDLRSGNGQSLSDVQYQRLVFSELQASCHRYLHAPPLQPAARERYQQHWLPPLHLENRRLATCKFIKLISHLLLFKLQKKSY